MKLINRKFGWKRDLPDSRDYKLTFVEPMLTFPLLIDLRPKCPTVYDQGNLGSCVANAIGASFEFNKIKQHKKHCVPSRLFMYYNMRVLEGTIFEDSGAYIRDGIKTLASDGVCPESQWKYNVSKFTKKPYKSCYTKAEKNQILQYLRVPQSLNSIKQCLVEGYPISFGFMVYESFVSDQVAETGIVPMPEFNEYILGGHAVLIVGYDDNKQSVIVRNSWGIEWGLDGYFYMPYQYLVSSDLSDDFWTIRFVE